MVQDLATQWYNHTHVKQKLLKKRRRACKSSWSRTGSQKSFTLTIPQTRANPVKIFPGIIQRQHLTVLKQMGLLRDQYAWSKKGLLRVAATCETYKISTLRTATRRTIHRTNNTVWFDGRFSPYFCQRPVATASARPESLTMNIPRLCILRGGNLERRHLDRRQWGIGTDGRIRNPCWQTQCKGSVNDHKWWKSSYSQSQMER